MTRELQLPKTGKVLGRAVNSCAKFQHTSNVQDTDEGDSKIWFWELPRHRFSLVVTNPSPKVPPTFHRGFTNVSPHKQGEMSVNVIDNAKNCNF